MPRSRTRARLNPRPAPNPDWPKARRAKLLREFDRRLDKLFARRALIEARAADKRAAQALAAASASDGGLSPGEDPCDQGANTPSMPR
jgi:hypothetical protein